MLRLTRHFWKQDWGAVLLALLVCCAAWTASDRFARLERFWYDLMVAATPATPVPNVVVLGIDEPSIAELGPWPWSRDLHAHLIDLLTVAGARLVVLDVPTAGAESEEALAQLQRIAGTVASDPELSAHPRLPGLLMQAQQVLDADAHLAASLMQSNRVLLSVTPVRVVGQAPSEPVIQWPLTALEAAALGIGHDEWQPDDDGLLRRFSPELDLGGRHIPSLALWVLAQQQGSAMNTRQMRPLRRELTLGPSVLPLDRDGQLRPPLTKALLGRITQYSARDVLSGRVPAKALAGRIVLIGPTAPGLTPLQRLSDGTEVTPVSLLAMVTATVLAGQLIAQPIWVDALAWLLFCGVAIYLITLAPRLTGVSGLAISSLLGTALLVCSHIALTQTQTWLNLMLPLMALLSGQLALLAWQVARQRWIRRHQVPLTELPSELSIGDDPFLSTPAPASVSAPAPLDSAPLPRVAANEPISSLRRATTTAPPAARPAQRSAAPVAPVAAVAAPDPAPPMPPPAPVSASGTPGTSTQTPRWPRLGRYQLDRELGHGSMGRVYLAHELQTSKVVVIKALSLAQEFEGEALTEARRRFRREVEAASRLQHPGIVRIHGSGEERGLAYLVMDWLRGHNLTQHTQNGTLLPIPEVLETVARVADALAHAHSQGVIHRDIKPSNVMIDPIRSDVTLTDFGIARIIDGRSTRTGMMLGSPLYMSPEQLLGRQVDGRSDLYSLGVLMFQLLTAELPIRGDSIAELIKSVTSQEAPDVRTLRPDVPQSVAEVLALMLEKQPELRYRNGQELAADLRLVAAKLPERPRKQGGAAPRPSASVEDVASDARAYPPQADSTEVIVHNRSG